MTDVAKAEAHCPQVVLFYHFTFSLHLDKTIDDKVSICSFFLLF